jgi:hypothetical protein
VNDVTATQLVQMLERIDLRLQDIASALQQIANK